MRPVQTITSVESIRQGQETRQSMLAQIGAYCAYCEAPLGSALPDARLVSVATQIETFEVSGQTLSFARGVATRDTRAGWDNTQLACAACAYHKGDSLTSKLGLETMARDDPERFTTIAAAIMNARGGSRIEEGMKEDILLHARGAWVWPEAHLSEDSGYAVLAGDRTADLFTFEYFQQRSMASLANERDPLVRLSACEQDQHWAKVPQDLTLIVPNDDYIHAKIKPGDADRIRSRVCATILGWNLNYSNPLCPDRLDRRVRDRDAARRTAEAAAKTLSDFLAPQGKDFTMQEYVRLDARLRSDAGAALLQMIRLTLRSTGFWSIWYWVVKAHFAPLAQSGADRFCRDLIYTLLIEQEIDTALGPNSKIDASLMGGDALDEEIVSVPVLPGTDIERVLP